MVDIQTQTITWRMWALPQSPENIYIANFPSTREMGSLGFLLMKNFPKEEKAQKKKLKEASLEVISLEKDNKEV